MAEVKLKYNEDREEVDFVVDDEVTFSSGADVFKSWVDAYNEKHPVEPVQVEEPVDTASETVVDSTESGSEDKPENKENNA